MFEGTNDVRKPQKVCPRPAAGGRENYEFCVTLCQQPGHAEEIALWQARWAGVSLRGAVAFIDHHRICSRCERLLREAGVVRAYLPGGVVELG